MEDEWIEWAGGEWCPLPKGQMIWVRLRNGDAHGPDTAGSYRTCWRDDGNQFDIVAYKIVEPAETPNPGGTGESPWPDEPDMVNSPPHYTAGGIETINAIRAALTPEEFRGYCKGSVLAYVWREKHKGGDQDLSKSVWYLNKLLEQGQ
jgi:hypothetical protein